MPPEIITIQKSNVWKDEVDHRVVKTSPHDWVVETGLLNEEGLTGFRPRISITTQYGALSVNFLKKDEWLDDAIEMLTLAKESIPHQ